MVTIGIYIGLTEFIIHLFKNTVKCRVNNIDNIQSWVVALSTEDKRADLIEKGTVFGKKFLDILDM